MRSLRMVGSTCTLSRVSLIPRPLPRGLWWQPPQWSPALLSLASHHHVGVPMLDTEDLGQMQRPWPALGDTLGYKVSSGWPLRRWIKRMVTLVLAGCWRLPERLWTMNLSLMGRLSTHTHTGTPAPVPWSPVTGKPEAPRDQVLWFEDPHPQHPRHDPSACCHPYQAQSPRLSSV